MFLLGGGGVMIGGGVRFERICSLEMRIVEVERRENRKFCNLQG